MALRRDETIYKIGFYIQNPNDQSKSAAIFLAWEEEFELVDSKLNPDGDLQKRYDIAKAFDEAATIYFANEKVKKGERVSSEIEDNFENDWNMDEFSKLSDIQQMAWHGVNLGIDRCGFKFLLQTLVDQYLLVEENHGTKGKEGQV